MRPTVKTAKPLIVDNQIIIDVAKGIELDKLLTLTQVIRDELKSLFTLLHFQVLPTQRKLPRMFQQRLYLHMKKSMLPKKFKIWDCVVQ